LRYAVSAEGRFCVFNLFCLHNNIAAALMGGTVSLATILRVCVVVYVVTIVVELGLTRQFKRFLLELAAVVFVVCLALLVTNASIGHVAFGEGVSPLRIIAIMFFMTMCGIVARYIFYLQQGQFSWLGFIKPLTITPIILLPLISSIQKTGNLNDMQAVSFAFLAFQNGFFWQAVLEKATPKT
jgi:hypothetical protein